MPSIMPSASFCTGALIAMLLIVASAFAPAPMFVPMLGAVDQRVDLQLLSLLYSDLPDQLYWNIVGEAEIDWQSERNAVVRGHVRLRTLFSASGVGGATDGLPLSCAGFLAPGLLCFDIPRAYIRARFQLPNDERMHITLGRTRVGWGDGTLFNAGDLLFGASSQTVDLTDETLRDESALLLAAFIPLSDFSFIEALILPPISTLTDLPLADVAAGLRAHGKIGDIKSEFGYLFRGDSERHSVAVSMQGNLGIDWYISAATSLTHSATDIGADLLDALTITVGMLHIIDLESDSSLSVRLESIIIPLGVWTEDSATARYGIHLYPEIVYSLSSAFQILARALVSPVDLSARLTLGVNWVAHSGFTLFLYPGIALGDERDIHSTDRARGIELTAGMRYVF